MKIEAHTMGTHDFLKDQRKDPVLGLDGKRVSLECPRSVTGRAVTEKGAGSNIILHTHTEANPLNRFLIWEDLTGNIAEFIKVPNFCAELSLTERNSPPTMM